MILTQALKDKLKANWLLAESMACKAELRVYDPLSVWQCYLIAMNPQDENEVACILSTTMGHCIYTLWTIKEINDLYNWEGEKPSIDLEYRPRMASQIFKQLNGG